MSVKTSSCFKRAIFVCGDKGGVGKTTVARVLLHLYRESGRRVAAYDTDPGVGQFMQYYGARDDARHLLPDQDATVGVGSFDLRNVSERDGLIDPATGDAEIVLMDLPADSISEIGAVVGTPAALIEAYTEHDYQVIVVVVLTKMIASTASVLKAVESFGDVVQYVVVKNLGVGAPVDRDKDFKAYDGGDDGYTRYEGRAKKEIERRGGLTVCLPALDAQTYKEIDQGSYTFEEAQRALTIGHSWRIKTWLNEVRQQLAGTPLAPCISAESVASA